jgi:hypothetical protein
MGRYAFRLVLAALVCAAGVGRAGAATDDSRVPVLTRLVQDFSALEGKLGDAVARGDRASLEQLVAEDFELRAGRHPGEPVPRAQWLADVTTEHAAAAAPRQMAVHDLGDLALVSFLWRPAGATGAAPGMFVVDLWGKADGAWRLKIRYAAVARGGAPAPAAAPPAIPFKKKY